MEIVNYSKLIACMSLIMIEPPSFSQPEKAKFETIQTFKTREARQGIAVDKGYFYTINSKSICKYEKKSGELITEWKDTSKSIIHFDGGVIVDEKLYCAHSNFPGIPMTSSIEVFTAGNLEHVYSHSFGIKYGSCTWADYYHNHWWVCFANYDQFERQTNQNTAWTLLVKFDVNWNEKDSWTFPENVLSEFKPMSCSGGSWGPDGNLYITGHDNAKIYIMQIPEMGSVLELIKTMKVEIFGQGIAWDRSEKNNLYGIIRKENLVVVSKLSPGGK